MPSQKAKSYATGSPKEIFAVNRLLPYMLNQLDYDNRFAKELASLPIFPYVSNTNYALDSLCDRQTFWFYIPQNDAIPNLQNPNCRILAHEFFSQKDFEHLLNAFGEDSSQPFLHRYSNRSFVSFNIQTMSKETDYTSQWWACALDIYPLWQKDYTVLNPQDAPDAISGIDENSISFLFDGSNCSVQLQTQLCDSGFFVDIFADAPPNAKKLQHDSNFIQFLKELTVPHSFFNPNASCSVPPGLIELLTFITKNVYYPVHQNDKYFPICQLTESLFFDTLKDSASNILNELEEYDCGLLSGIPIQNILGHYMAINLPLFNGIQKDFSCSKNPLYDFLLSDNLSYLSILKNSDHTASLRTISSYASDFKNVNQYPGIDRDLSPTHSDISESKFYLWLWDIQEQHSPALALNILCSMNSSISSDTPPNKIYVLKHKKNPYEPSKRPNFEFEVLSTALNFAELINPFPVRIFGTAAQLFRYYAVVSKAQQDNFFGKRSILLCDTTLNKLDISIIKSRILDSILRLDERQELENDSFWDSIYWVDYPSDELLHALFISRYNASTSKTDQVLLLPTESPSEAEDLIRQFLFEERNLDVRRNFDGKQEYNNLTAVIRKYLDKPDYQSEYNDHPIPISYDNVRTAQREERIWGSMRENRDQIRKRNRYANNSDYWREFLIDQYHGTCQLCGKRIPTGSQNAHFFIYRIQTESKSQIANIPFNIFSLCPSCHGELRYGYLTRDLHRISELALKYVKLYKDLSASLYEFDDSPSVIQDIADEQWKFVISSFEKKQWNQLAFPAFPSDKQQAQKRTDALERSLRQHQQDSQPDHSILCDVTVNNVPRLMAFTWEHFIHLAFIYDEIIEQECN